MINQAILKNQLAFKAHMAPSDEDHSKVNLLALLKQLNQRKSSEEANNLNNNPSSALGRKITM